MACHAGMENHGLAPDVWLKVAQPRLATFTDPRVSTDVAFPGIAPCSSLIWASVTVLDGVDAIPCSRSPTCVNGPPPPSLEVNDMAPSANARCL